MPKKKLTKMSSLLLYICAAEEIAAYIFEPTHRRTYRALEGKPFTYRGCLYKLIERGLIKISYQNDKKVYSLTDKGQLEALLAKAVLPRQKNTWDGKWRLIMFDIPEDCKDQRDKFRRLLKSNNFFALQASVYISPFPLNHAAIQYLKITGLIAYIRILRVDAIDDDRELRKRFNI